jgi:2'-5' RNA ligase
LSALQDALARGTARLGFSLDVRPYVPHLTLARDARKPLPDRSFAPLDWRVESFVLVASELLPAGPRYRILHERRLERGAPAAAEGRFAVESMAKVPL